VPGVAIELELKLGLDDAACAHWRAAMLAQGAQPLALEATYFDSADGRLRDARMALRLRREGTRWVQTFKAAGDSPIHRLEHELEIAEPAPGAVPDLALHDDAGDARAALRRALGDARLEPRHTVAVERLRLHVRSVHGTLLEMALDVGEARAGGRRQAIAELELEHVQGPLEGLFAVAHDVLMHGGAWLSTITKAERGERLAADAEAAVVKAGALVLPRGADGDAALRAVLRNALDQVLPNASAVAEGSEQAEHIHQLRVGLRRLRTALRELAPLDGSLPPLLEAPLAEAFGLLGQRRDSESVGDAVRPLLEAAGAPRTTWAEGGFPDTRAAVRAPALQTAFLQVLQRVHAEAPPPGVLGHAELKARVAARLAKLHRQVLRDGRRFDRLPAEDQHRVRKRLKRLRYLAEFMGSLWPARAVARTIEALKPAQEALGAHNDTVVAAERFAADAKTEPDALFAAGFLRGHLALTEREARRALRAAAKVPPFWKRAG
jgi:inorganic triphosphatase YgiF